MAGAGTMSTGGTLAWAFLRRNPDYRAAWVAAGAVSDFEAAPFPVRIRSERDAEAARFGLLAWEDPFAGDGPASPFWAEAPMLGGELVRDARPLLPLLESAGARIEGLRLAAGALVLKIERGGLTAQVRIAVRSPYPEGTGLVARLDYGLPLPLAIERVNDLWSLAHGPAPPRGRARGGRKESF